MSANSYDYSNRTGVWPVSWEDFHGLVKALALVIAPWDPEIILPIVRGGNYPGTLLAHLLQVEVYPVRLTRRNIDVVVRQSPAWLVNPPAIVAGKRVLVVDEVCSTGETLKLVKDMVREVGATDVHAAVLYAHTWGTTIPEYIGVITDDLVLNPWDREIYCDGSFVFHPEYEEALAYQGNQDRQSLLINTNKFRAAKPAPEDQPIEG